MYPPGTRLHYTDLRVALPARIRPTAIGIATIGCQANPLGVRPLVDDRFEDGAQAYDSISTVHEYLDGCERWTIDRDDEADDEIEDWVIEKTAGPYLVEDMTGGGLRLTCACGWKGKTRAGRARRMLKADQAAHWCEVPRQGTLE